MSFEGSEKPGYVVPRYRAGEDTAFYHFLHGTVPGHQIDFMYRPDVPQGALTQTHFGHLARLIKYIEPREKASYAFALGNLSRDDVQHEPGHGGLALLFALRVPGVTDHAGRDMPPYAHGVVAVNRALDYATLLDAATAFYQRFLEQQGAEDGRGNFYRAYVQTAQEQPEELGRFLARYIADFTELPHPRRSELGWDFVADEAVPAKRITIVHDDDEAFGAIAHSAAALGSLLYRSNIKWTSITSGREIDIAGGTTIRFVSKSEAPAADHGLCYAIDDLPGDEDELAMLLFGAKRRAAEAVVVRQGWREKLGAPRISPRSEPPPPPPPRTPPPPPPAAAPPHDSVDRAEEVDDAAATLPMAPLEPDPTAAAPSQAFDARQSSPVKGLTAVDLRSSSPVTGMRAPVTPPLAPTTVPSVPSNDASMDIVAEPPAHRSRWIMIAAAAAAIGVIAVVVTSFGLLEEAPGSGSGVVPGVTAGPSSAPSPLSIPVGPGSPGASAPNDASSGSASVAPAPATARPADAPAVRDTDGAPPATNGAVTSSTVVSPPASIPTQKPPKQKPPSVRKAGGDPVF